jgi:hypothetical protein
LKETIGRSGIKKKDSEKDFRNLKQSKVKNFNSSGITESLESRKIQGFFHFIVEQLVARLHRKTRLRGM